jgi:two-component system, NarL family, response regulator LiaR
MDKTEIPFSLKVLLVDDQELPRSGLKFSLQAHEQLKVVGEAENGKQALEKIELLRPDIILMDIMMPVMDGIVATQQIKAQSPELKVIILTSSQSESEVYAAMTAGADAYCVKTIRLNRLVQVIEMVAEGALWMDPVIAKVVLDSLPAPKLALELAQDDELPAPYLTNRELEVLKLIVDGKSNKEIAVELVVTVHTVKAHVSSIIQKLAVDDRTQAAIKGIRTGLITL